MKRVLALLMLAVVFQPAFAQTQFFDIPKAAVQFDGIAKPGTYTWSGTNLVVTTDNSYAFKDTDHVWVSFTNSTLNGYYAIAPQGVSGRSLTLVNTRSGSGSGNVNVRVWVKADLNIASVVPFHTYSQCCGISWFGGVYKIHFTTRFINDRYIAVGGSQYWRTEKYPYGAAPTASTFDAIFYQADGSRDSPDYAPFLFYGTLVGETP